MSYYYEDAEYAEYGNYGDNDNDREYETYSDSAEPDHSYPEPSEPDHYGQYDDVQHHDDANHGDGTEEYRDHEAHECEPDWEAFEQAEMDYGNQGGYLQDGCYEMGTDGHHPEGSEYEGDDTYEHGALEHDDNDNARAFAPPDRDAVELLAPFTTTYVPAHPVPVYTHPDTHHPIPAPIPCPHDIPNSNQQGHVTALKSRASALNNAYDDERRVDNHNTSYPTSTHTPCYTPKLKPNADELFELFELELMFEKWGYEPHGREDDINEVYKTNGVTYNTISCPPDHSDPTPNLPPLSTPPTYTYLETLCRDYNNGIPSAIAFMQGLQDYTEECQFEQEEWKADERAVMRNNHNITYPKRDTQATPRSWYADGNEYAIPSIIEQSFPLGPGLKRRRYRNVRTPRYRTSQPRPPLVPRPPPELDDNIAPHIPPSPTTRSNKHHTNNRTPKPPRNVNFDTTPYLTSQSRPPPWPNKNSNKNRNKYYHGTHTPAGTTVRRRPPPWPIIPTPTTIYSITNSRPPPWLNICHCRRKQHSPISSTPHARPPPWPIIPHYIHSTSQNRWNAKRRVKAKSRIISDEVSV